MRFVRFAAGGETGLGLLEDGGAVRGFTHSRDGLPDLGTLAGMDRSEAANVGKALAGGPVLRTDQIEFLPPIPTPGKVVCVGLNYTDHTKESGYEQPDYPTIFPRFASSLIGHGAPIVRPDASDSLDFEGELAVVIGKGGRHIARADALDHVFGYSVFNDGSVREYQFKSPQWTVGKNFDGTGAIGPAVVTVDELPAGASGLRLETRLNGETVQSATTADMIFPVADLIAILSEAMTLQPGDLIVTGTPSGIGWAREPKLLMQAGDRCEVEVEGVGLLANPIVAEGASGTGLRAAA